jgi:hypothetical protein
MTQSEDGRPLLLAAGARLALTSLAVAAALALIGYWPTSSTAGSAGVTAMLVGIGVSLVGAWIGTAPVLAYLRKPPREHANGILLGLGTRFAATLGLALAACFVGDISRTPLLLWVAISQFVILMIDVVGMVSLLKRVAKDA